MRRWYSAAGASGAAAIAAAAISPVSMALPIPSPLTGSVLAFVSPVARTFGGVANSRRERACRLALPQERRQRLVERRRDALAVAVDHAAANVVLAVACRKDPGVAGDELPLERDDEIVDGRRRPDVLAHGYARGDLARHHAGLLEQARVGAGGEDERACTHNAPAHGERNAIRFDRNVLYTPLLDRRSRLGRRAGDDRVEIEALHHERLHRDRQRDLRRAVEYQPVRGEGARAHAVDQPEACEYAQRVRHQPVAADFLARERLLVEGDDTDALPCQAERRRRAGGAAAGDRRHPEGGPAPPAAPPPSRRRGRSRRPPRPSAAPRYARVSSIVVIRSRNSCAGTGGLIKYPCI